MSDKTQAIILRTAATGLCFTARGLAMLAGLPLADVTKACRELAGAGKLQRKAKDREVYFCDAKAIQEIRATWTGSNWDSTYFQGRVKIK